MLFSKPKKKMDSAPISRWRKRRPLIHRTLFLLLFPILFIFYKNKNLDSDSSLLPPSLRDSHPAQHFCVQGYGEKFMWYTPHSGFGNQLLEFKNAVLVAAILNRTLIVPPVLDHHAVALGSCPKFRVFDPNELRFRVWNHIIQLLLEGRYVSMADVMDLSTLVSSSAVRFIDFRAFVSMWCQVNMNLLCSVVSSKHASVLDRLEQCGLHLAGYDARTSNCLHALQDDCRTTVWTYQTGNQSVLDSFQPNDELKRKRKISYSRYRKDIYHALGPGSAAGLSTVLAFGSLFTASYAGSESHIDIHEAPKDQRINSLIKNIKFIPFASEIVDSGKDFALNTIKTPFFCLQLRLLDGQFKNHWRSTFLSVSKMLDSLKQNGSLPINAFVMTDLPFVNWTGSYLGNLSTDPGFKVYFLREDDHLVMRTAKKIVDTEHRMNQCRALSLPDVLLYLEQTVCSCASLGFIGTSGSTIAEAIELMRKNRVCH